MRSILIGEVDQSLVCYASDIVLSRKGETDRLFSDQDKLLRWFLSDARARDTRLQAITKTCCHPTAPEDLKAEIIAIILYALNDDCWRAHITESLKFHEQLVVSLNKIRTFFLQSSSQPMLILIDLALNASKLNGQH